MNTISKYILIINAGDAKKTDEITFGTKTDSNIIKHYINAKYNDIAGREVTAEWSVVQCNFDMEMFRSGHVSIELSLKRTADKGNNYPYAMSDVQDALQGAKVTLKYTNETNNDVVVATNYFIYDLKCVSHKTDNDNTSVILDIYSVDKLLDLQPMTKAYTASKLSDIITSHIDKINAKLKAKPGIENKLNIKPSNDLSILRHRFETSLKKVSYLELLLPYLVQYDESFYSFIRRVCSRCGEFLYFEHGLLHYGLQPTDPSHVVKFGNNGYDYNSISTKRNTERFKQFDVTTWHRDSITKDDPNHPTQEYVNESQIGNNDFIQALKVKDRRKSPLVDLFANGKKWKEGFGGYAKDDNLIKEIYQVLRIIASAPSGKKALIKTGIELLWNYPTSIHMKQRDKDNRANKCNMLPTDEDNERSKNYTYIEVEQNNESEINQFSTVGSVAKNTNNMVGVNLGELTEELYNAIHYWATENATSEIEIDLGNYATEVKLGTEIMIPNDNNPYVVTAISGSIAVRSASDATYSRIAHAIPKATIQLKDKESQNLWLPTPIENVVAKAQGPMTGFVTETDDPYRQGRVRVRMSWQNTTNKDATPWVRVAMPMAGEWGNMTLQPGIGDEVLVDFENGNMERPYVRGSLYNSAHEAKILKANTCVHGGSPLHRSFTSGKGTGLFIEDQDFGLSDWLSLISPVLGKTMLQIPQGKQVNKTTKLPVGAKMELKDYYGFYKIAMSSKDRQVSIESPLGKVSINAFTGISISAPNGDIKIEGKNIDIKAGNRLTLTSGTNIGLGGGESRGLSAGGTVAEILLEIAKAIADSVLGKKLLDLSLVRSVLEIFLRPVNCTMQIKSRRHLVLEAGRGTAEIPYDSIKANANAKYKNVVNAGYPYYIMRSLFVDMQNQTDGFAKAALQSYNALANFAEYYVRPNLGEIDILSRYHINTLKFSNLPNEDKTKLSVDKCSQLYDLIQFNEGEGKYKFTGTDNDKDEICPIPSTMKAERERVKGFTNNLDKASDYKKKWRSKVDEFIRLVCNYLNAMRGNQLKYNEAIDAIVASQSAKKLLTTKKSVRKAFEELKNEIGKYSSDNRDYCLFANVGDKEEMIPFMDKKNFLDAVKNGTMKKATRFSLNGVNPASPLITYLFIKALNKVELLSYVGTDKPMANGKYNKNHTIPADLNAIFKADTTKTADENWETFLNGIVPYFHDEKKIGFIEKAADKLQGFLESEIDYDNIKAVEGMFNGERDMWDATVNRGSIVMSDSTGSNTTRLEDNGEFKKYENASIQTLIKAFKTTIAPKPQAAPNA